MKQLEPEQCLDKGGVREVEVALAEMDPAQVSYGYRARVPHLAQDRSRLLEMMPGCLQVIYDQSQVTEIVV
jgi:hypothetical protein